MKCFFMALALSAGDAQAEAADAFTPPQSYPSSRYEPLWVKNPFTLKTPPPMAKNVPFAENLVIAAVYGSLTNPTVVLVNIKTHERIRLQTSSASLNGIRLVRLHRGNGRRDDMLAVVSQGSETSEIHYGRDYLKQVAAAGAAQQTQSILQKRQQSLNQHSGGTAPPAPAARRQGGSGGSSAQEFVPGAAPQQDAWLAAGSFNQPSGGDSHGSKTDSSSSSSSHSSAPSSVAELSGAVHMSLRRYTYRAGDELAVPHPDPQ